MTSPPRSGMVAYVRDERDQGGAMFRSRRPRRPGTPMTSRGREHSSRSSVYTAVAIAAAGVSFARRDVTGDHRQREGAREAFAITTDSGVADHWQPAIRPDNFVTS